MEPKLIIGATHRDQRGAIHFCNAFNMQNVVRFYDICPQDTHTIRGWQGHMKECKWFYCTAGSFTINTAELEIGEATANTTTNCYYLSAEKSSVLLVPGGYATAFQAHETHSRLLVFSDFSLEDSKQDDFRFPIEQWSFKKNVI